MVTFLRERIQKEVFTKIRKGEAHGMGYFHLYTRMPYKSADWGEGAAPLFFLPAWDGHVPRRTKERERNEGKRVVRKEKKESDTRC